MLVTVAREKMLEPGMMMMMMMMMMMKVGVDDSSLQVDMTLTVGSCVDSFIS